ncbi:hypothetical protein [Chitinimonas naiadis]
MKRLAIDFSPASPLGLGGGLGQRSPWLVLLWLAALLALLVAGWRHADIRQRTAAIDRIVQARVQQAFLQSPRASAPPSSIPPQQRQALNDATHQLNLPWAAWFAAFESAASPKVTLLAITPNPQSGTVAISAECDNPQTMLAYLAALRQTGFFRDVVLRKHRSDETVTGGSVRFDLIAYVPTPGGKP